VTTNITFTVEEWFRTPPKTICICLDLMALKYYCTLGALMIT